MPYKVTPVLKATLVDCVAACTIRACFSWLLKHLSPKPVSGIQSCFFPSVMTLLSMLQGKPWNLWYPPGQRETSHHLQHRISHAVLLPLQWSGLQLCEVFTKHMAFLWRVLSTPQSCLGRVVAILSSSSWYKFKIALMKKRAELFSRPCFYCIHWQHLQQCCSKNTWNNKDLPDAFQTS